MKSGPHGHRVMPCVAAVLLLLCGGASARADRVLVEGAQRATYLLYGVPDDVAPRPYENSGFTQRVKKKGSVILVDVAVRLDPLESRAPFPPKGDDLPLDAWEALLPTNGVPVDDPEILRTAVSVLGDAHTQYEAVNRIIDWVSTRVEYVIDPQLPTGALETLRSRKAYCVGMANLAVSILRTVGIPARNVHGILAQREAALSGEPVSFTSAELHRWIEVYVPGTGWVFSDPLRSCHFVDAHHMVLYPHEPGDPYDPSLFARAKLRLVSEEDASYGADRARDTGRYVLVRPNLAGRFAAAVVGVARSEEGGPPAGGVAILVGGGATRKQPLRRGGRFSFTGIPPGVYQLRVYAPDHLVSEHSLRLGGREIRRISVTLERP